MLPCKAKLWNVTVIALAVSLSACNSDSHHDDASAEPSLPQGLGYSQSIGEPQLGAGEQAVVDSYLAETNNNNYAIAYSPTYAPMLQILKGFDKIYTLGDDTWSTYGSENLEANSSEGTFSYTGVNGGATKKTNEVLSTVTFENARILDMKIWKENFDYVKTLTRQGQDTPDTIRAEADIQRFAYLDDQREKGYSITSGLGPLASAYRKGANAVTTLSRDSDNVNQIMYDPASGTSTSFSIMDESRLINTISDGGSGGTNYGQTGHDLDAVVSLLHVIAGYGASTEAPKYHFQSPRPWRIEADDYSVASFNGQDKSNLQEHTCYNPDGSTQTKYYENPVNPLVEPITGLKCVRRATYTDNGDGTYSGDFDGTGTWVSSRAKDGAFPSGHTTEAYDRGLGMAYAMPQRFAEMVARAAELGHNRIVAGMHSPLDVIGGRIMAEAVTAAAIYDPENREGADAAVSQAEAYLSEQAKAAGYDSVYAWAQSDFDAESHDAMKARYRAFLTYGLSKLDEPAREPEVPKGAEILLKSRFPYLDGQQRRAVLATTEIASNYPVISESHGWGRLDLVAAADGYSAFDGDVDIYMDGLDNDGFNANDYWRNDISGKGRLRKDGTGTLHLTGDNTYTGGTLLVGGTLVAGSSTAFGDHTLYQEGGTVDVSIEDKGSKGALTVSDYVQKAGTLSLDLGRGAQVQAAGSVFLNGGALKLTVPRLSGETRYTVIAADHVEGEFGTAAATDNEGRAYAVSLQYDDNKIVATLNP
ncbi:phosphatase PAP2 family protein [Marinobacter nanhaiticus D15-8W]|uniref:Phosphatase PAP2 family protein n=1 Tax=Marinobacter nanhaiticus D15-8W TaxID=626887 RepID=N6WXI8_9GAMM|nr:phosphatase PAP2 family protein [Marinobacter nanhaiticus]ENO15767.1 phosphatase PAP2 family protein [Marinobacter nanhaiticus D15-8W]BES73375.1 phosphatase PAP2 family protein [Marinobacter nanhaiticus D15-8W]